MSRRTLLALPVLGLLALLLPERALAQSTENCPPGEEETELCKIYKSMPNQDTFAIAELPGAVATQALRSGEAFMLYHECRAVPGGLSCSGWPQEEKSRGNLRYQWTFESQNRRIELPPSDSPVQAIKCAAPGAVVATLTIGNGKYRATSSETYACGQR